MHFSRILSEKAFVLWSKRSPVGNVTFLVGGKNNLNSITWRENGEIKKKKSHTKNILNLKDFEVSCINRGENVLISLYYFNFTFFQHEISSSPPKKSIE